MFVLVFCESVSVASHLEDELGSLKVMLDRQKQEQQRQEQAMSDRDAATIARMGRERQDKELLEARIEVLEEHNVQLMTQLQRLRQLLQPVCHVC